MPEVTVPRPVLRSFRVLASNGQNRGEAAGVKMRLEVQQEIEVGLAVPDVAGAPLMLGVRIKLDAKATNENDTSDVATYAGEYEARFYYAAGVTEETITPLLDDHEYQYILVAQAFPLAMTHFRRELQAMGLDARELPLGLDPSR
ncbi:MULTISPECIES: hypothetical protein [Acidovorax]|jgi:hypothetical protein|uniref:Preprotein translocase subunit SecB n=1 Tax=Acidovorax facilis TaxID=12917 RepID=A0ABV8D6X0_9BURK|nr:MULTISPECIES: hypothetical protein [Acidovorax]KQB60742.1 hypothetical protein AE621_03730 [Acidovorax sp. SD340]MBO1008245.1 hypothetical protein [Acidovorax sp. SD340]MCO4244856.1 hypothetical protein [Acidovorax facilis]